MESVLANCLPEREAFSSLLNADCRKHIVTFQGESGTGKTTLLNACLENISSTILHIPLNCKGSAVSVAEVFSRTGFRLSWDRFPTFIAQVAELSETAHVTVDGNWLMGINNKINVALKAETPLDRKERRVALTDAWFKDVRSIKNVLLISIDTFEQATPETSKWVSGPFLFRAADTENLRVLIAGQKVPDHHEHASEWGYCCNAFQLVGIKEAKFWMPVIESLGYVVPNLNPLDFMAGICHVLNGRPAEIMKVIEGFPKKADKL